MQRCISRVLRKSHPLARPIQLSNARSVWNTKRSLQTSSKTERDTVQYQRKVEHLPKARLGDDGKPRAALPPFSSTGGEPGKLDDDAQMGSQLIHQLLSNGLEPEVRTPEDPELEAKWRHAVKTRVFPDTPLAHGIFVNMQKYPDDIILTRVGMFYEVSLIAQV